MGTIFRALWWRGTSSGDRSELFGENRPCTVAEGRSRLADSRDTFQHRAARFPCDREAGRVPRREWDQRVTIQVVRAVPPKCEASRNTNLRRAAFPGAVHCESRRKLRPSLQKQAETRYVARGISCNGPPQPFQNGFHDDHEDAVEANTSDRGAHANDDLGDDRRVERGDCALKGNDDLGPLFRRRIPIHGRGERDGGG